MFEIFDTPECWIQILKGMLYMHIHQRTYTHYSAGVGRTGTLITIDRVLDQLQKERVVDIAGTICHLRTQRMKMVQNVVCTYNISRVQ